MPATTEQEICKFFINKSKEFEAINVNEAKAWLLTGRSLLPKNFSIQLQCFQLEKRQKNVEGCARCFALLFELFPMEVIEEVNEMANGVKAVTLSTVKETEEDVFLYNVFNSLPVATRMEVLMHRSEHTPILLEKCQSVLLMVKLFPDVVNQHGGNMLYTLSGCDADVHSPFRSHLVTELVPAVLRLCKNLQPSPSLITLLSQCIEYYVLVDESMGNEESTLETDSRWDKLYGIVDQIGGLLSWKITPFFRDAAGSSNNVETLYQSILAAVQRRSHYSSVELAYIAVVIFLRCITSYYEKLSISNPWKFGEKTKLTLVEVFVPPHPPSQRNSVPDPNLPIITTISPCSSVASDSSQLLTYFITATKIWQMIQSIGGERLKKEYFAVLNTMKSLNFEKWPVFQEFEFDFLTYTGAHVVPSSGHSGLSSLKLASMYCGVGNFQSAADHAIRVVNEINSTNSTPASSTVTSPSTDSRVNPMARTRSISGSAALASEKAITFSFYNSTAYEKDNNGYVIPQRRVHFISENKSEMLSYAVNVLIQCLQSFLTIASTQKDDRCMGHLMTLLQLEWYSPPADMLLSQVLEIIKRKGSFKYFPYFADFVIEADILEQFMALANNQAKPLTLDIFTAGSTTAVSSSRRMGTRGVERGAKNDFKAFMKKQILKNARENLEALIIKFLTLNKAEIVTCLDV